MSNLDIQESEQLAKKPISRVRKPKAAKAAQGKAIAAQGDVQEKPVQNECRSLLRLKGDVLRLKAINLSNQRKCEDADELLEQAAGLPRGPREAVAQGL